jgi:3-oxoacyl-[acyl-carrier-protein] synthase-1
MRRAVITGLGIVSSIGNNKQEVLESLKASKSGITVSEEFIKHDMRSHICGDINLDVTKIIPKRIMRYMGRQAAYAYISMEEAIKDSGLTKDMVSNPRTGLISGSGDSSSENKVEAYDVWCKKGIKRVKPFYVPRTMGSTCSSTLATPFEIKGINYSISSACATSAHCIGNALEQIQLGKQDIVFAGGGEEVHWTSAGLFDCMRALSSGYNDTPEKASRAYDADRDGFIIAGGGGMLVIEEYEHAIARGAKIYAEIVGYGATSDGFDMFVPSGEGAERCMAMALSTTNGNVDYINTHGTSTPMGDLKELDAIKSLFSKLEQNEPFISSTKSLTGHAIGAAGVHESIYSLLMMENDFIAPSVNIDNLDDGAKQSNIVTEIKHTKVNTAMTNSFGFGGTNVSLVFKKINNEKI